MTSGILCSSYINDGKDVCGWIALAEDFATSHYSLISREPAYENIICLEDCTVQGISHSKLNEVYKLFPETERAGRLILEDYYSRLEEHLIAMRSKSAKERYNQLFDNRPELFRYAPLGRIASYLGMSQETLSRIRAEY